jgi:hypothetical protein
VRITGIVLVDSSHLRLTGTADPNSTYSVESSLDLIQWEEQGQTTADETGAFEYIDFATEEPVSRFYRIMAP